MYVYVNVYTYSTLMYIHWAYKYIYTFFFPITGQERLKQITTSSDLAKEKGKKGEKMMLEGKNFSGTVEWTHLHTARSLISKTVGGGKKQKKKQHLRLCFPREMHWYSVAFFMRYLNSVSNSFSNT